MTFEEQLKRATAILASARIIAAAINAERRKVKMADDTPNKGAQLPTFSGIATAFDKLTSSLEFRATRIMQRIEQTDARGANVEKKSMAYLDATDKALDQQGQYFDAVEKALGGNGVPLATGTTSGTEEPK